MSSEAEFIFVYGTLRPALGHYMQRFLKSFAEHLGEYIVAGELHDLGSYPGFIAGTGRVRGDVYRITDSHRLLSALDLYEGDEYTRELISVDGLEQQVSPAEPRKAWIYVYRGSLEQARRIESGDYVRHRASA